MKLFVVMIATVGFLAAQTADAAQYVYPSQGQDKAKQASDEAQCSTWATQQTGFDPAKAPAPSGGNAVTGSPTDASALTGALGAMPGGMGGAAGMLGGAGGQAGALTGALGSVPGGMGGAAGMLGGAGGQTGAASQALGMVNQAVGKHPQGQKPGQADYDKARAACLMGRGYSVQ
jgi:hypothetical protein